MEETPSPQKSPEEKAAPPAAEQSAPSTPAPGAKPAPKVAGEKPAPKAAGAKPAAAKAAKKPAKPKDPLIDNGDGTVTDPNSGLMWKQSDAWLDTKKYYTWPMHQEYVDKINKEKFSGYEDWRIPTKTDALTLFDKTKNCMDKNGSEFFVDPIFAAGGVGNTWISECSDENITRYDWKTGVDTSFGTAEIWASMRLVRKP